MAFRTSLRKTMTIYPQFIPFASSAFSFIRLGGKPLYNRQQWWRSLWSSIWPDSLQAGMQFGMNLTCGKLLPQTPVNMWNLCWQQPSAIDSYPRPKYSYLLTLFAVLVRSSRSYRVVFSTAGRSSTGRGHILPMSAVEVYLIKTYTGCWRRRLTPRTKNEL